MAGSKGMPRRGKYRSIYDGPRPIYTGPHWIGKPITPPPVPNRVIGDGWIGVRIPPQSVKSKR